MRRTALVVAVVLAAAVPASAHLGSHEVSIRNNFYQPEALSIDPGETVTWTAIDGGHTVTADGDWFDHPASGTLDAGTTTQWTAPMTDVTVPYACRIHASMRGVIIVGEGSPVPPPPIEPVEVRAVPSPTYPTIASALAALPPRARVEIAPGTYPEAIIVQAAAVDGVEPDISLVGLGAEPDDVVIAGGGVLNTGVGVLADGVHLDNFTVSGFTSTGVLLDGVTGFTVERVDATSNGSFGIRARRARSGRIATSLVGGSAIAGIAIQDCGQCDVLVQDVRAVVNLAGISVSNAGAVVVKNSVLTGNGVGVALKSVMGGAQRGSHILNNLIEPGGPGEFAGALDRLDLDTGAGVWIAGGWFNVIEANKIGGEHWGVLVTGFHHPVFGNRIAGNVITSGSEAHLAWDGIGAHTCFANNEFADGSEPATQPPMAGQLYPCSRPTVGIPYPPVVAAVLARALG